MFPDCIEPEAGGFLRHAINTSKNVSEICVGRHMKKGHRDIAEQRHGTAAIMQATAASSIPLWLASGWGYRDRRLSRGRESVGTRLSLWRCLLLMFSYVALEDGIPVSGLALQGTRASDSGQVGRFSQGMEDEGEQVLQPAIPHGRMQTETRPTGLLQGGCKACRSRKSQSSPRFTLITLQIFHAPTLCKRAA